MGEFFYEAEFAGITFHASFAAKIEERTLGLVAATKGTFKWTIGFSNVAIDFIITEEDNTALDQRFARYKGISVYLRPKTDLSDQRPYGSIKVIDDIVTELVGGETMER